MNIEITFIDSFPTLEKLTKDNDLFIFIKNQKFNLKNLEETKQVINLKNIQEQILLKLLIKDNTIIGINNFNPLKFKELFSMDQKSIFHWLDFKKEKNAFINNNNSNFFLYEYIRLKTKIAPLLITNLNNTVNQNILTEENSNNNLFNNNKNISQSIKSKFNKSFENNSKTFTTTHGNMRKSIINLKKKNRISLNYYPSKKISKKNINLNNYYKSTRNMNSFTQTNKNNNSISFKQNNISSEKQQLSSYKFYKNIKLLKASNKKNSEINNNKKNVEREIQLQKKKLSLFGDQLLLKEDDEILNKSLSINKVNLEENFLSLINNNKDNNKETEDTISINLQKNENIRKEIIKNIKNFQKNKNNYSHYVNYNRNLLPKNHDYTTDSPNFVNYINTRVPNDSIEEDSNKYENEINQFYNLKNDFELFYTQKFFKYIKNDVIYFEYNLFLKKSLSIFNAYNSGFSILYFENKTIINLLNYYRMQIKLLKKKIYKLTIIKEDIQFKLKNLDYLKQNNNSIIKGIKNKNLFKNEILKKTYNINLNIDKSLKNILQKLIASKYNLIKDIKTRNINRNYKIFHKGISKEKIKYKTIDIIEEEKNDLFLNDNLNFNLLNKDDLNKSMKTKKSIQTPSKEHKYTKIQFKNSFKTTNSNNGDAFKKIFKTKSINIKKNEKNNLNNSKGFLKSKSKKYLNRTYNSLKSLGKKSQTKK